MGLSPSSAPDWLCDLQHITLHPVLQRLPLQNRDSNSYSHHGGVLGIHLIQSTYHRAWHIEA